MLPGSHLFPLGADYGGGLCRTQHAGLVLPSLYRVERLPNLGLEWLHDLGEYC